MKLRNKLLTLLVGIGCIASTVGIVNYATSNTTNSNSINETMAGEEKNYKMIHFRPTSTSYSSDCRVRIYENNSSGSILLDWAFLSTYPSVLIPTSDITKIYIYVTYYPSSATSPEIINGGQGQYDITEYTNTFNVTLTANPSPAGMTRKASVTFDNYYKDVLVNDYLSECGTITGTGSGSGDSSQTITLTATPISGYKCSGWWLADYGTVGSDKSYTIYFEDEKQMILAPMWEEGQEDPQQDAIDYAKDFNTKMCAICEVTATSGYSTNLANEWSTQKTNYNALSTDAKAYFTTSQTQSDIAACIAKYTYILVKYNAAHSTTIDDFMLLYTTNGTTDLSNLSNKLNNIYIQENNENSVLLVILLSSSLLVLSSAAILLVIKKKKKSK